MAHKTLVDGTAYEVSGGRTLVDGTGYSISGGKTLVDGTGYDLSFSDDLIIFENGSFRSGVSLYKSTVSNGKPTSIEANAEVINGNLVIKNLVVDNDNVISVVSIGKVDFTEYSTLHILAKGNTGATIGYGTSTDHTATERMSISMNTGTEREETMPIADVSGENYIKIAPSTQFQYASITVSKIWLTKD